MLLVFVHNIPDSTLLWRGIGDSLRRSLQDTLPRLEGIASKVLRESRQMSNVSSHRTERKGQAYIFGSSWRIACHDIHFTNGVIQTIEHRINAGRE